jgi:beta-ribofuranosylaminobenzene 5'-phosphate synthase
MLRDPAVRVAVRPAAAWGADGPAADRALAVARRCADALGGTVPPHHVTVEACPPEHVGLGVGTQLGLAVARALCRSAGRPDPGAAGLARLVGRGARSALGVHGFAHGGFLIEGGKADPGVISPLVVRADFPAGWRVVLLRPPGESGWHGPRERAACAAPRRPDDPAVTDRLCRLALLGLLPALADADAQAFGEALHEFNAVAGEPFRAVQGGPYSSPVVGDLVTLARGLGIPGAGQSSWGPTVFAVTDDPERAADLVGRARRQFSGLDAAVSAARNGPAQ